MSDQHSSRTPRVAAAFAALVDQLVGEFDVIELLTTLTSRSVDLLEAAAAGILLADQSGHLRVMAASSEAIHLLDLFQVQNDQGPCLECYATGQVVASGDLAHDERWPLFAAASLDSGFPAVCAVPMRLAERTLGALNLFMDHPVALAHSEIELAKSLAGVASIAIVQGEALRESELVQSQLQNALDSRTVIEQAKGMIAQAATTDMDEAFERLRGYARSRNLRLSEVALGLADGSLDVHSIASQTRRPR